MNLMDEEYKTGEIEHSYSKTTLRIVEKLQGKKARATNNKT